MNFLTTRSADERKHYSLYCYSGKGTDVLQAFPFSKTYHSAQC